MSKFNFDSAFFRKYITNSDDAIKLKPLSHLVKEAVETFYEEYDYYPDIVVFAPGKFTIMGDHLDYLESHLIQAALPMVTIVVGKALDSIKCKIVTTSKNVKGLRKAIFPIEHYRKNLKVFPDWVNYIKGLIRVFPCKSLKGFDAVIHSNIPVRQGYGSSAALQVAFYKFLEAVCPKKLCNQIEKKADFCRLAEKESQMNKYKVGLYDHITSFFAKESAAVSINCRANKISIFDMRDIGILFLLIFPNFSVERNDRNLIPVREAELKLAAALLGIKHIRDATEKDLEVLFQMKEPPKEAVENFLRGLRIDEEVIDGVIEDLYNISDEYEWISVAKERIFDDKTEGEIEEEEEEEEEEGEKETKGESENDIFSFMPQDRKKSVSKEEMVFRSPSAPVSYIQQRITELCDGYVKREQDSPVKICEEIKCLGGLENLSIASDISVTAKLMRRVRHIVTEKMRCLEIPELIQNVNYEEVGSKLIQSHLSLKLDYDVSCATLDNLVQVAIDTERVYGSKMMSGGGTLTLLHRSVVEEFINKVIHLYGSDFQFYLVFPSAGAAILDLEVKKNPASTLSQPYSTATEVMKRAVRNFELTYKYRPTHGAFSPGALNLIGDHTDYNHGFTLSMAVNLVTVVVGAFNGTFKVRAQTTADVENESTKVIFNLPLMHDLNPGNVFWAKYVRGVVVHFKDELKGFDCLIETSLPKSSGIASKTALVLSFYTFLEELTGKKTPLTEKAYRCMRAEHEFTNSLCGVGEQNIALRGKENYVILFDSKANICIPIPFQDPSVVILLTHVPGKTRQITKLLYTRMEECYEVARALGRKTLRCFTVADLEAIPPEIKAKISEVAIKRARHVLTENERVLKAAEALKNNDFDVVGELMVASHNSLRDFYEVSDRNMDCLVSLSMEVDGVLGSKMPCSGYQGCIMSLVKRWAVDDLIEYLQNNFKDNLKFNLAQPAGPCGPLGIKKYIESLPTTEFVFEDIFPF